VVNCKGIFMDNLKNFSEEDKYNLFKKTIESVGVFHSQKGKINILGIRGLNNGEFVEENKNTLFDDTIAIIYIDNQNKKRVTEFNASCEPGRYWVKKSSEGKGAALLAKGQHKYKLGYHKKSSKFIELSDDNFRKGMYRALQPSTKVKIWRVKDADSDGYIDKNELKKGDDNDTINIHYGGEKNYGKETDTASINRDGVETNSWSHGCQIIVGKDNYRNFIQLIEKSKGIRRDNLKQGKNTHDNYKNIDRVKGYDILYTLIEAEELLQSKESIITFPINFPIPSQKLASDINFDYFNRLNENAQMFGHFPVGIDMQWHGGMHIPAAKETYAHNVYPGEIVAAKLNHEATVEETITNDDGSTDTVKKTLPSNGFVIVKHQLENGGGAQSFFSLHMHLHDETRAETKIPWLQRVFQNVIKYKAYYTPNEFSHQRLAVWENVSNNGVNRPKGLGAAKGLAKGLFVRAEFEAQQVWKDGKGNTFVMLDLQGKPRWVCIQSGKNIYADCRTEECVDDAIPRQVKDLMGGKYVSFHDADDDTLTALQVKAAEPVGRVGKLPVKEDGVLGEHFEIFSGDDIVQNDTVGSFDDLPQKTDGSNKLFLKMTKARGSFPDQNDAPNISDSTFDKNKKPAEGVAIPVDAIGEESKNKFARIDLNGEKRWIVFEWPGSGNRIYRDGELTKIEELKWVKVDDSSKSEWKYDKESMAAAVDLIKQADPELDIPNDIMKRGELKDFYLKNNHAFCMRHCYVHSLSEWSRDVSKAMNTDRLAFLKQEDKDKRIKEWDRYWLWKHLPQDLLKTDGFAQKVNGSDVWQYLYQPMTFLRWLGEKTGNKVIMPAWEHTLEPAYTGPMREIVFAETDEIIDELFSDDFTFVSSAENRWIYAFDTEDGTTARKVWEIQVNEDADFACYELTEQNYDTRPDTLEFLDTVMLPKKDDQDNDIQYMVCLSEFRLPKERIFDVQKGIVQDLTTRTDDIEDTAAVKRGVGSTGIEMVALVNYLAQAEKQRQSFDETFEEWKNGRKPSSAETIPELQKFKLLYEFGALLLQICEAFPDYKKHIADYPAFYDYIKARDEMKKDLDNQMTSRVQQFCHLLNQDKFHQCCIDYTALISAGDDQDEHLYDFEERVAGVLDELSRFPDGMGLLKQLFPEVKTADDQSWLQDLILLKNDLWNADGSQGFDTPGGMDGMKKYENGRKIADGLVKLITEGAKAGIGTYKPEEMQKILQKAFSTTLESIEIGMEQIPSKTNVRPFLDVFTDFSDKGFWRYAPARGVVSNNFLAKVIASDGMGSLMLCMETVSVVYQLIEMGDKGAQNFKEGWKFYNDMIGLTGFIAENVFKMGKAPIAALNAISATIDLLITIDEAGQERSSHDYDAATFKYIASIGLLTTVVGSGAIAATFFAGAAASSATGIGIAPGLLLAVVGSVIAVGGKIMAELANNTQIEDLLLKTPWGTHPSSSVDGISNTKLFEQYYKAIQILNKPKISINVERQNLTMVLKNLEPESIITLHQIKFAVAQSDRNNQYTESIVGENVMLTSGNCVVTQNSVGHNLSVDLLNLCLLQKDIYWTANTPDYINVILSIDVKGDKKIIIPDKNKKFSVQAYRGQSGTTTIV